MAVGVTPGSLFDLHPRRDGGVDEQALAGRQLGLGEPEFLEQSGPE
jgi:hypothetical protein